MRGGVSRALLEAIMKIILGIDVGSSTTKIVALDEAGTLLKTAQMWTSDTLTSIFGSAGRILHDCGRQLQDVEKVMLTGVRSVSDRPRPGSDLQHRHRYLACQR